jgi:hypothetical protein
MGHTQGPPNFSHITKSQLTFSKEVLTKKPQPSMEAMSTSIFSHHAPSLAQASQPTPRLFSPPLDSNSVFSLPMGISSSCSHVGFACNQPMLSF